MARFLLIDGREALLGKTFTCSPLLDDGWVYELAHWNSASLNTLRNQHADLIVAAAEPTCRESVDFFRWLRENSIGSPTIAVVPERATHEVMRLCFEAADDVVVCPLCPEELRHRIERIVGPEGRGAAAVMDRFRTEWGLAHLVGRDPTFLREIEKLPLAAQNECEVLITGETGTGKELCARAIHHLSRRRDLPFICVDCGALPDQLFENEFFGHERGAFTDARQGQKGLVAMAERGTLFLDEIDSLSLTAQAKLLRFLEDHTYKPLGSDRIAQANVRIVVATNGDLQRAVDGKVFRRDLYFRVNVLGIHLTPLRERRGDIEPLAQHFLERCCAEMRCPRKVLALASLELLSSLDWPGNVRELYNVIRRAVVFSSGPTIGPRDILPGGSAPPLERTPVSFREARVVALTAFERRYVEAVLRHHGGNISRAARESGKDRRVFGRLVKRLGINPAALK